MRIGVRVLWRRGEKWEREGLRVLEKERFWVGIRREKAVAILGRARRDDKCLIGINQRM